jgi:hypothetical protein
VALKYWNFLRSNEISVEFSELFSETLRALLLKNKQDIITKTA